MCTKTRKHLVILRKPMSKQKQEVTLRRKILSLVTPEDEAAQN